MRSSLDILLTCSVAALLVACGSAPEDPPAATAAAWTSLADRPCPDTSDLGYDDFGGPFFLTWCTGCHGSSLPDGSRQGAPVGVDFDSLDGIRAHAPAIWARAADGHKLMPPVGGPDDEARTRLGEWLACGMR